MTSVGTSSYLPALPVPHEREGAGRELQSALVDLIDPSLIGKQLHWAAGGPQTVAAATPLRPVASGALEDHVVVRELTHRIADVSERVRDQMNRVGEADLASQDVLIEVVRELEKQQWMLRVQLGERA
jgi:starvation-inducible DNA-binding protein